MAIGRSTPVVLALFLFALSGVCLAGTPAAAFDVESSPDARQLRVYVGEAEVLRLTNGNFLRLRCDPSKDQWLGYDNSEIQLGWAPNDFPAANVTSVRVEEAGERLRIAIAGEKPSFPGSRFQTSIEGEFADAGRVRFTIESELRFADGPDAPAPPTRLEFLDVWIDRIFWPEKYRGSRELYEQFVFGTPDGVLRAPKLHIFTDTADRAATFETLAQPIDDGSFLAVVDSQENGYMFRVNDLSARSAVGICWWTWDPHFFVNRDPAERHLSYSLSVEAFDVQQGRALLKEAQPIPFRKDRDYQLPVVRPDRVTTFRKRVAEPSDWTWERTLPCASLDRTLGYDDSSSATIQSDTDARCAWYTRILSSNFWDPKPLKGRYRVSAMVRTRGLNGQARIGVVQSGPGPETVLYREPSPTFAYSEPASGDTEWREYSLDFEAVQPKLKVLLEQQGSGQAWFDNVRIMPLCDPIASEAPRVAFHARDHGDTPLHRFDFWSITPSQPWVLTPEELKLAWADSWVMTPAKTLEPGEYRLVIHAKADGCTSDRPVLLVQGPPGFSEAVPIRPNARDDYMLLFTVRERQPVSFRLSLVNDGPCTEAGQQKDKNAFVLALTLAGP